MPLLKEIAKNSDRESHKTTGSVQAYTDTATRDNEEKDYYTSDSAGKWLRNRFSSEEIALLKKEFGITSDSRLKVKVESMDDYDLDVLLHRLKNPKKPEYPDYQKPDDTKKPPTVPTVPSTPKPPTDLPEIIKPSQINTDKITDTGTGGLSAFQAAKNVKHISGVDYNYLLSLFNYNEAKAQKAVIDLREEELREMIEEQKGLSGYAAGQLGGSLGVTASGIPGTGVHNNKKLGFLGGFTYNLNKNDGTLEENLFIDEEAKTASGMWIDFSNNDPLGEGFISKTEGYPNKVEQMIIDYQNKLSETIKENTEYDMDTRHFVPVEPQYLNNEENRWAGAYDTIIDQFDVENRDRYQKLTDDEGKTKATYCNLFAWDVTSAMDAELPHWVNNETNEPYQYNTELNYIENTKVASELTANGLYEYLNDNSDLIGYREVTPEEAQKKANQGYPTIAIKKGTNKKRGHVVVIRPNHDMFSDDITIAQAGGTNFNDGELTGISNYKFYTHD